MTFNSNKCELSKKNYTRWKENSKTPFSNPWFNVLEKDSYFSVEHLEDQVMILAVVDECSVLLVKAKRQLLGHSLWELPAGGVNKDETPLEAASRELSEETGIKITDPKRFVNHPSFVLASNRMPMFPHIFHLNLSKEEIGDQFSSDEEIERVD